jgi:zinc protease
MYPIATSFEWQVDKEMTVFTGTTHVDNLDRYYSLIRQMLLEPGFRDEDFSRLKSEATNFLKVSLREGNDEELGKEQLYNVIYAKHPYGHHNLGTLNALERLTVDDARDLSPALLTAKPGAGLAGGYPAPFPKKRKRTSKTRSANRNTRNSASRNSARELRSKSSSARPARRRSAGFPIR